MLILTIRTSDPVAEIGLFTDNGKQLSVMHWKAHRHLATSIHDKINQLLVKQDKKISDVDGIDCFEGPGSFTGLRIGLSVGNAISYSLEIPIAGARGQNWLLDGIKKLLQQSDHKSVIPYYGAPVHITPPKK
jgi:tRNA threonylcarbamoyladenosine biosynthesis protein TsaB